MALRHFPTGVGEGGVTPTTPTFAGIVDCLVYTGGIIKPRWAAATDKTQYNIYLRAGNADVFSATYWVCSVPDTFTSALIGNTADGAKLIQDVQYYIGVRALNETVEDANAVVIGPFLVSANNTLLKVPVNVVGM